MIVELLLRGLLLTLVIWVAAFGIAVVLGIPVAAARRSRITLLRQAASAWITVWRAVPPLVWMFVLFFGVTFGGARLTAATAAIVALGLVGSAYMAENYRSGLESIANGQWEAVSALALGRWVALRVIVLPQCLPVILAATSGYAINLVKDTALASLIGVSEMTFFANDIVQRSGNGMAVFLTVGLLYVGLSIPLGLLARFVQSRFQHGGRVA